MAVNSFVGLLNREELSQMSLGALDPDCEVHARWGDLADHTKISRQIFPMLSVPEGADRKKYLSPMTAFSFDEIVQRVADFVNVMPSGFVGTFRCLFPLNPEYRIIVRYGEASLPLKAPFNNDLSIFVRELPHVEEAKELDSAFGYSSRIAAGCIESCVWDVKIPMMGGKKISDAIIRTLIGGIQVIEKPKEIIYDDVTPFDC